MTSHGRVEHLGMSRAFLVEHVKSIGKAVSPDVWRLEVFPVDLKVIALQLKMG